MHITCSSHDPVENLQRWIIKHTDIQLFILQFLMPTYNILYYSIEKKTPAFVYICIQDGKGGGVRSTIPLFILLFLLILVSSNAFSAGNIDRT